MSPARILVVENEHIVAKALARRLERLGYVVVAVATSAPRPLPRLTAGLQTSY
jgi:CheY-like chemotaxis protein